MPIFEIQGPNGETFEIDAPDEQTALQSFDMAHKANVTQQFDELPWYGKAAQAADDTARMLANGLTLGHMDQFAGYMNGDGAAGERAKTEDARTRGGTASTAAEILGSFGPASVLGKAVGAAGLAGSALPTRTLSMAGQGALLGAGQAAGTGQDVTTGAVTGGVAGGLGNLAGEAISAGASKIAGLLNKAPKVMTGDELRETADAAFKRADAEGVIYKPEALSRLRDDVRQYLAEMGFHPSNQPGAGTAYDEISRLVEGGNVNLTGLKSLRELVSGGYNPMNKKNNTMIADIISKIDDLAADPKAGEVLTGNSQAASSALKEGRDYWGRMRKLETVDKLTERAGLQAGSTGSGGNVENATRQQLRRILTDKNLMRGFKADEKEAIKKAVLGTPGQNALRLAGKLSPQGNGLMAALSIGGAMSNPILGIPSLVGIGAKKAAEGMTAKNVELVRKLVAAGGDKAALAASPNAIQSLAQAKREALSRLLMTGGVVLSGR